MGDMITRLLASDFNFSLFLKASLALIVVSLLLSTIGRFVFGKRSSLNHAVSSAIGILFVYATTIVIYSTGASFASLLGPLPFLSIGGGTLHVFSFAGTDYTIICSELLSMIILAFGVNLIDTLIPKGKRFFGWLLFRCLTVVLAIVLHLVITYLFRTYLPEGLVTYAPTVLLFLLILLLLVGALKFVVGALLATVNPVIAAFYTFFFASLVGKQLTKSIMTTAILSGLVFMLHNLGCTVISIASVTLIVYLPLMLVLLAVWFFVSKIL